MTLHEITQDAAPRLTSQTTDLSVIIGTYRSVGRIEGTLRTVLSQCRRGIELIVVDDGSDDGTTQQVRSILGSARADTTLITRSTNDGIAGARNLALRHAAGEFAYFMDDDDELADRALDTMLAAARRHDADMVLAQAVRKIVSTGEETPVESVPGPAVLDRNDTFRELARGNIQGHLWNKLFRIETLGAEPFPPLRSKSDFGGVVQAVARTRRAVSIPDRVYTYLWRDGTISTSGNSSPLDLLRVFEPAMALLADQPALQPADRALFRLGIVKSVRTELWRLGTPTADAEIAEAYCRGLLDARTALRIARAEPSQAGLAFGLAITPGVVRSLYLRKRSGRLTKETTR